MFQQKFRLLITVWGMSRMKEYNLPTLYPKRKDSFLAICWCKNHSLPKLLTTVVGKLRWMLQHSFRTVTSSPACLCPEDYHPPMRSKRGVCLCLRPLLSNKCAVRHQSVTLEANWPMCQFYHRGSNHRQSHSWYLHTVISYTALTRSTTACLSDWMETPNHSTGVWLPAGLYIAFYCSICLLSV